MFGIDDLISAGVQAYGAYQSGKNTEANNATQLQIAAQNIALQKEFAQQGIQWKVADAKAAGIHPLAALGANTTSFSPVTAGTEAHQPDLSSLGQSLGRAFKASQSSEIRKQHDEAEMRKLELEEKRLDVDVRRAALASRVRTTGATSGTLGPSIPLPRPGPNRTVSIGQAVGEKDIDQKAEDFPQTAIVRPFGYPLYANPWFNDGQQFEDRYGDSELGSTIKFGVNTLADHAYTGWRYLPEVSNQRRAALPTGRYKKRYRMWGE